MTMGLLVVVRMLVAVALAVLPYTALAYDDRPGLQNPKKTPGSPEYNQDR